MKIITLIFFFFLSNIIVFGQVKIPISLISPAGGIGQAYVDGSNKTLEWTIGETFIGGGSAGDISITIGEQQDFYAAPIRIDVTKNTNTIVYPNPANDFINICQMETGIKLIKLLDVSGRLIEVVETENSAFTISTIGIASGLYILIVIDSENKQINFKISIN